MACCKGEKYNNWCKDERIVWTDNDTGDEYCFYHAPKDQKGIPDDRFAEIFMHSFKQKSHGMHTVCYYRGAVLVGEILLKNMSLGVESTVNMSDCVFEGAVSFAGSTFGGNVFKGAVFKENVDFSKQLLHPRQNSKVAILKLR